MYQEDVNLPMHVALDTWPSLPSGQGCVLQGELNKYIYTCATWEKKPTTNSFKKDSCVWKRANTNSHLVPTAVSTSYKAGSRMGKRQQGPILPLLRMISDADPGPPRSLRQTCFVSLAALQSLCEGKQSAQHIRQHQGRPLARRSVDESNGTA